MINDKFITTKHVPKGMKACSWCCTHQNGLYVMPGFFRDIDVDNMKNIKLLAICPNCYATGIDIGTSKNEQSKIIELRHSDSPLQKNKFWSESDIQMMQLVKEKWIELGSPKGAYSEIIVDYLEQIENNYQLSEKFPDKNVEDFTPDKLPKSLECINNEFLMDLHDFTLKFGTENVTEEVCRIDLLTDITISVSTQKDNLTILIINNDLENQRGAHVIALKKGFVYWDKNIPLKVIIFHMINIDHKMRLNGLIDDKTGERSNKIKNIEFITTKHSVEKCFAKQGSTMPAFIGGPNAEELRKQFDEPEKIAIINDDLGFESLCHVRDVDYLNKRKMIVTKLLKEKGISLETISSMKFDDILKLRQEIEEAMK